MISFDYSDKAVLVTGAGPRGLAWPSPQFHEAGATVFVNDRTAEMVADAMAKLSGGER
jgi:NADPH-dependent glutamate synthase beta subunit-like oxidoreductase